MTPQDQPFVDAQATTETSVPPTTGTPAPQSGAPKPGIKKGLLFGIIGGAIGLVLLVVAAILWFTVFSGPSKADYETAHNAMTDVRDSYTKVSGDFSSYVGGVSSGRVSGLDTLRTSLADYRTKVNGLKDLKAFRDPEVKTKHDEYITQNDKFVTYIENLVDSGDQIETANTKCGASAVRNTTPDYSSISDSYKAMIRPCMEALDALSQSKNEAISNYAKQLLGVYKEQEGLFAELQTAFNNQDSAAVSNVGSKISLQASKFNSVSLSAMRELSTNLNKPGHFRFFL